ncbi:helix-turn-helix domain-containing protein [Streptomyces nigra]|uniref:hypothetical protein n=1 Tax=Streptomyces nigra TaxID=1827580 RepID=UPI00366724D6
MESNEIPVRVIVVEDAVIVRLGLVPALESIDRVDLVGLVADAAESVKAARRLVADVVVLGLSATLKVRLGTLLALAKTCRVLVLVDREGGAPPELQELRVGASGCLVHRRLAISDLADVLVGDVDRRPVLSTSVVSTLAKLFKLKRVSPGRNPSFVPRNGRSKREVGVMRLVAPSKGNLESRPDESTATVCCNHRAHRSRGWLRRVWCAPTKGRAADRQAE